MLRRYLPDLLIIALLFMLPLILFWPQTLGGKTLIPTENLYQYPPFDTYRETVGAPEVPHNHLLSDLVLQNYQWKAFIRESLAQGEVPLWNPHQFSGIPFLAAGQQSALYPLSVLYYVLPLTLAYGWFTVVNLWLAGAFMYAYLRGVGAGRFGGTVAGVTYQLCGFFVASAVFPMILGAAVWLPLLLLMAEFIIQRRSLLGREARAPWAVVGAGALACSILAGHVEITIYTLLIVGYYSAARLIWELWTDRARTTQRTPFMASLQSAAWLGIMVALGFGAASIQFIPLLEFVQTNWRAERSDINTVLGYAHPLRDAVQYVMPNFYGSPAHHSYYDVFAGQTVTDLTNAAGQTIHYIDWGIKNYVEGALYVGILPLALALFGVWDAIRTRRSASLQYDVIFAGLAVVSLTFMFGLPTYRLLYLLPGINQLNSPFRWVFGVTVGVAILAGFGAQALAAQDSKQRARRFGYALVVAGLVILGGLAFSRVFFNTLEPTLQRIIDGMVKADEAFADARMFYSYQFKNVLALGLVTLGSGAVFWAAGNSGGGVARTQYMFRTRYIVSLQGWKILAIGLIAVDLMIASWGFNPASDPALLDFTPPAVQWLLDKQAEGDPFRYTTLEAPGQHAAILQPNATLRYGLDDVRGYDSIIPADYVAYMRATAPQNLLDFNRVAPLSTTDIPNTDWRRLNLLNVRYLVAHASAEMPREMTLPIGRDPARYTPVYEDESVKIWQSGYAYHRVFIYYTADAMPPVSEMPMIQYTHRDRWQYGDATITHDTGREKFIDTRHERAGWLVISENYADGWRAFIRPIGADDSEEESLPVTQILDNLQGIDLRNVPAGQYTIRVVYSPVSFQVGLFGSVVSAALLIFTLGVWVWRLFVGANDASSTTVSRVARNSIAPIILNLFNRGIDFAFAFVMLRILGPEDAGIYYYAIVIFVWFDIFTNFGLDVFLIREASRHRDQARRFFLNTTVFRVFLMFACVPVLLGLLLIRQSVVADPLPARGLLAIGLLYIGLAPGSISKGMTSLFYAFERAEYPAAVTTLSTISKAILGLAALLFGYGIVGLAAASIVTNLLTLAILLWGGRKLVTTSPPVPSGTLERGQPRPAVDRAVIRGMAAQSWPLMLNHFLATIFFQIDIVLLEALKGAIIVGKYSVAYRWLLALNVIPAFFTQALLPVMSRQAREDRDALKRTYTLGIKLLVALTLPIAILFTFWANGLTLVLGGSEYMPEGAIALQIMIWSIPFGWINSLTQYTLIAVDLQRRITRAFIIAVTFNITSNLILIPQYGYQAAAVTTIFSELVLLIPFGVLLQGALGKIGWLDMVWRPGVAGGLMAAAVIALWGTSAGLAVLVGIGVYAGVLLTLRPLNARERAMLLPLLPGRFKRRGV